MSKENDYSAGHELHGDPARNNSRPRVVWVPPPEHALQLKITLRYLKPPVWRRVVVPDNYTLGDLHYVIQRTMGWLNEAG